GLQRYASEIAQPSGNLPGTTITGVSVSPGGDSHSISHNNSIQWIDNFSFSRGAHALKAGVEIRRVQLNSLSFPTQSMVFASFSDFAANRVGCGSFASPDSVMPSPGD
ncbi:MAG: hypothetical protein ABIH03_01615, partial [Pseudomonadota bacterium]